MKVLIIYATVEGQTAKIAGAVAEHIEAAGHQVELTDVREPGFAVPGVFDAVVVCAPVHMARFPEPLVKFVKDFKDALNQKPSAFISVSLSAASEFEDERKEAEAFAYNLARITGWTPTMRYAAAGAIKYLEYNYFKRYAMRRIFAHKGGPVDTSADYELTDWPALKKFTEDFLAAAFSGK